MKLEVLNNIQRYSLKKNIISLEMTLLTTMTYKKIWASLIGEWHLYETRLLLRQAPNAKQICDITKLTKSNQAATQKLHHTTNQCLK